MAWEIYSRVGEQGIECAYVDLDQVGICHAAPLSSDAERYQAKNRNLRALACNFSRAGARGIVVSGVENPLTGGHVNDLPRTAFVVCRLRAEHADLTQRLAARRGSSVQPEEALTLADQMDRSNSEDVLVETSGLTSHQVAQQIMEKIGDWPRAGTAAPPEATLPVESPDGPILWLCGPTGVGKSTVGFSAYLALVRQGLRVGYVDIDQIGFYNHGGLDHRLRARNLSSLWKTFRSMGADALVAVGPIQDQAEGTIYEDALLGATFTWCRLHAGREQLTKRIMSRRQGGSWPQPGDPLRGRSTDQLRRVADEATAEAARFEVSGFGLRVDSDALTAEQTASLVLSRLGWPGRHI